MAVEHMNYQVRAVSRALRILTAFTPENHTLTLSNLSTELDLHKSTLIRLLSCLEAEGFIEKTDGGDYRLSIKAYEIGSAYYLSRLSVAQVARSYTTKLVERWQLSANQAVLDHDEIVYIDIVEPNQPLRVKFSIGSRAEVHCTALGKVLVSEMDPSSVLAILAAKGMKRYTPKTITDPDRYLESLAAVRALGYALDQEEIIHGVRCVAAPIRGANGQIISALSLSGPTSFFVEKMTPPVVESLIEATSQISGKLLTGS